MATQRRLTEALGRVHLFHRCTSGDHRALARRLQVFTVEAGTEIVTQGGHGEVFYVVLSGELAMIQDGETTATLRTDDHFGELALLDPAPRSATIVALTDAELGALSIRTFVDALTDMPQIASALLAVLANQLRRTRIAGTSICG